MRERLYNEFGESNGHVKNISNMLTICLKDISEYTDNNNLNIHDVLASSILTISNHFTCHMIMAADKKRKEDK